jgi:predicted membrane channel-forming protein YqfA (hemolysin III family)
MSQLLSGLFLVVVAFNTYSAAKRAGRWSWPQFFVVVAALVAVPLLIVLALMDAPGLQDKPVLFTLIATGLIMLFVCALAYALKRFWPLNNPRP